MSKQLIVAADGSEQFREIADAVAAATRGTRIVIKSGKYTAPVVLTEEVEIVGDGPRDGCTLAVSVGTAITVRATGTAVIRGLTLRAPADGVDVRKGSPLIEGCATDVGGSGISAFGEGRPLVRNCRLVSGFAGFCLTDGASGTAESCTMTGNANGGVFIRGRVVGAILRDCTIISNRSHGVRIQERSDVRIEGCTITDNACCGIIVKDATAVIWSCIIRRNGLGGYAGVWVTNGSKAEIGFCDLRENGTGPIKLEPRAKTTAENNVLE